MFHKYKIGILILALVALIIGCKDGGTGADPGEPPSLPELKHEDAQMDVSFFQQNNPKEAVKTILSTNNFNAAKSIALGFSGAFASVQLYEAFLQPVSNEDATFDDGVWEWKYSYNYEGVSVEIQLLLKKPSKILSGRCIGHTMMVKAIAMRIIKFLKAR